MLTGTPVGNAQGTSSARIGTGALLLDGSGDLIDLGTGSGPAYTSQLVDDSDGFTVACWANVPIATTTDRVRFFSSYANGAASLSEGWGIGRRNTSKALAGTTYGKVDFLAPANSAPAAGAWHHYTHVFHNVPVNRIDFYVDAVLVSSQTTTNPGLNDASNVGFAIGALGRSNAFEGFDGLLDDLRIYETSPIFTTVLLQKPDMEFGPRAMDWIPRATVPASRTRTEMVSPIQLNMSSDPVRFPA